MEYNCKYKRNCTRGSNNNNNVSRTTVRFQLTKTFFNKSEQQHHTNKLNINMAESSANLNIFKLLFYLNNQNCMTENHFTMLESFKHTFLMLNIFEYYYFGGIEELQEEEKKKKNYRRTITEAETSLEN